MDKVIVVMSTYNGEKNVKKQLDSICSQRDVEVELIIRDDGSTDKTWDVLNEYRHLHKQKISLLQGENLGWERSFLIALHDAGDANFYAFSDQDDVWIEDKLIKSIAELTKHDNSKALMFHCNRWSCKPNLEKLEEQSPKWAKPLSRENAVTQEYAQGCTIVINRTAKELVCRYLPNKKIPHDFWTGMICYYFGEVYYSSERLIYHINYGNNASSAGNIRNSQINRIKAFFKKNPYPNVAPDLLNGYFNFIDDTKFLSALADYKNNFMHWLWLLINPKFRRFSIGGTILLKLSIFLRKI